MNGYHIFAAENQLLQSIEAKRKGANDSPLQEYAKRNRVLAQEEAKQAFLEDVFGNMLFSKNV